jgi:hypothetical protein
MFAYIIVVCYHSRLGCLIKRSHCRKVCFILLIYVVINDKNFILFSSYLVIVPKLLKVGYDNQFSVFIAAASQPVQVKFELTVGQQLVQGTTTVNPGMSSFINYYYLF